MVVAEAFPGVKELLRNPEPGTPEAMKGMSQEVLPLIVDRRTPK